MKIVQVVPIARGMGKECLSYFSAKDVEAGTIVTVPIRKKLVEALVLSSEDLSATKSSVKLSDFKLKKVEDIKGPANLSAEFLKMIWKTKDYFAASAPEILAGALPKVFWENHEKLANKQKIAVDQNTRNSNLKKEKLVLQNPLPERISFYKTFIRESFAKKKSVFICVPSIHDAGLFAEHLQKGIEEYCLDFHSEISKKEFIKKFNQLKNEEHPVLVIATPPYLFLADQNFGAIIIEKESSGGYKGLVRPYLDFRIMAEILAHNLNIKIIFADTMLRVETLKRFFDQEIEEVAPISFRIGHRVNKKIIDTKPKENAEGSSKKFKAISDELLQNLKEVRRAGGRSFLFALRKGLAPITVCNDCKNPLLCKACIKPLTLYQTESKKTDSARIFICHSCRQKFDAKVLCETCGSWDMRGLGIGTEMIAEELKKDFPEDAIFRLDKENAKTPKQAQKIISDFYRTPGAILVGTEMALYYADKPVDTVAVVSFDSLFSIPDFRIGEKIIHLLLILNDLSEKNFLIQTKNPADQTLNHFLSGNLAQFFREEIENRERFNYPPCASLVKITFRGNAPATEQAKNLLEENFNEYSPAIYKTSTALKKGSYAINAILRIKKENWSLAETNRLGSLDHKLLAKIQALPQSFSVQIDPEDIF